MSKLQILTRERNSTMWRLMGITSNIRSLLEDRNTILIKKEKDALIDIFRDLNILLSTKKRSWTQIKKNL